MPQAANFFDSTFDAQSAVLTHFKNVSKQMGYEVLPSEGLVNNLGYSFLGRKMFSKAYTFFEMNIKNFPGSLNVLDSMGDYYDAKGDKQKAIEYYEKALAMNHWDETRSKLEKLRSAK